MNNIYLTKEADALLGLFYKNYLEKRKNDKSIEEAKSFGYAVAVHSAFANKLKLEDFYELCRELAQSDMLSILDVDDAPYIINLKSKAIVYMENRFQDKAKELLDYFAKIKSILLI